MICDSLDTKLQLSGWWFGFSSLFKHLWPSSRTSSYLSGVSERLHSGRGSVWIMPPHSDKMDVPLDIFFSPPTHFAVCFFPFQIQQLSKPKHATACVLQNLLCESQGRAMSIETLSPRGGKTPSRIFNEEWKRSRKRRLNHVWKCWEHSTSTSPLLCSTCHKAKINIWRPRPTLLLQSPNTNQIGKHVFDVWPWLT